MAVTLASLILLLRHDLSDESADAPVFDDAYLQLELERARIQQLSAATPWDQISDADGFNIERRAFYNMVLQLAQRYAVQAQKYRTQDENSEIAIETETKASQLLKLAQQLKDDLEEEDPVGQIHMGSLSRESRIRRRVVPAVANLPPRPPFLYPVNTGSEDDYSATEVTLRWQSLLTSGTDIQSVKVWYRPALTGSSSEPLPGVGGEWILADTIWDVDRLFHRLTGLEAASPYEARLEAIDLNDRSTFSSSILFVTAEE